MVQGTDIAGWISQNVIRFGKIYTPRRKLIKSTRCTEIARKLTNKKESKRFYIASRWMAKIATQNTVCGKISALFHVTFYFWLIFTVLHHIAVCFPLNMNGNIRTHRPVCRTDFECAMNCMRNGESPRNSSTSQSLLFFLFYFAMVLVLVLWCHQVWVSRP